MKIVRQFNFIVAQVDGESVKSSPPPVPQPALPVANTDSTNIDNSLLSLTMQPAPPPVQKPACSVDLNPDFSPPIVDDRQILANICKLCGGSKWIHSLLESHSLVSF